MKFLEALLSTLSASWLSTLSYYENNKNMSLSTYIPCISPKYLRCAENSLLNFITSFTTFFQYASNGSEMESLEAAHVMLGPSSPLITIPLGLSTLDRVPKGILHTAFPSILDSVIFYKSYQWTHLGNVGLPITASLLIFWEFTLQAVWQITHITARSSILCAQR